MNDTGGKTTGSSGIGGRTFVWDVPTRLFHWLLVLTVTFSIISGQLGNMDAHLISGLVAIGLIVFRLGWGLVGGRHARFTDFVRGPKAAIGYFKASMSGNAPAHAGHNPLGGWSVLAMLAVVGIQAVTGLFANDDIATEGPLAKYVSGKTSNLLTSVHEANSTILYILIGLHIAAVLFYFVKGQNLVRPMLTGWKQGGGHEEAAGNARGSWILAVILAAVAVAIAYAIPRI